MRSLKFLTMIAAIAFLATACVSDGQNTQRELFWVVLGAVAGQAIGHNTAGTLIGAGAGALTGAVIGNTHDQQVMEWRMQDRYPGYPERPYGTYYGPESPMVRRRPMQQKSHMQLYHRKVIGLLRRGTTPNHLQDIGSMSLVSGQMENGFHLTRFGCR